MRDAPPQAHVLVVDDTQAILDLLLEVLEMESYHVCISPEPLDPGRMTAFAPDVIVQDLCFTGLPETGWRFLTLMRREPELSRIPLILCTAATTQGTDPAQKEHLDRLGVRVLLKPFEQDELLTTIAQRLSHRRGARRQAHDVSGYAGISPSLRHGVCGWSLHVQ